MLNCKKYRGPVVDDKIFKAKFTWGHLKKAFWGEQSNALSQVKPYKKGVYVDGHEREDVVKDRQERFLPEMEELMRESVGVREELDGSLTIINEDAKHIIVSVDQKAHHSNERPSW